MANKDLTSIVPSPMLLQIIINAAATTRPS